MVAMLPLVRCVRPASLMETSAAAWSRELLIPTPGAMLPAQLEVPADPRGLVVFVHGQGSNRFSSRNRTVARSLQMVGLATVLFDLLCADEQHSESCLQPPQADLGLMSARLLAVLAATAALEPVAGLPVGLFGSSTGAAVALVAAAQRPRQIRALVSRGGRPDLVLRSLGEVVCPTLLLVGSHDLDVLELNTWAAAHLQATHELRIVPGAGHLFGEPGALEQVCSHAQQWFLRYLTS
jgi:putative phosphoribosyl transferase